ncbi:uncharacterized protein LOC106865798 [Brachypodium distachyon]|uniref:Uncharacterized protein n=1 Tax=Brachypodium distachyon TaxID=15368 RepID=A0A0Q3KSK4_BRADI|nr:uncharacterized protein LOC106865798 [Brachypodium distachyon]KQK14033.2 hypothetical protein BRADI_1g13983v3 [Brachypodium distachyon]|eukprot:XP_014752098.1 uncharacterized protein LOC106865798 [Brachypodium distachyon]
MGRTLAVPVTTALSIFLLLNVSPSAATRPVSTRTAASSGTSALAVAPSASNGAQRHDADTMSRAGKWLPYPYQYGGAHYPRYPRYYTGYPSQGKPAMWAAPSLGAYGAGKTPSPYVDVTRQEQVAMWASLLNPAQRPTTTPAAWLPAAGDDEPAADQAHDEPNRALDAAAAQGAEMDVPAGGGGVQNKWGVYEGSNNNGK